MVYGTQKYCPIHPCDANVAEDSVVWPFEGSTVVTSRKMEIIIGNNPHDDDFITRVPYDFYSGLPIQCIIISIQTMHIAV